MSDMFAESDGNFTSLQLRHLSKDLNMPCTLTNGFLKSQHAYQVGTKAKGSQIHEICLNE